MCVFFSGLQFSALWSHRLLLNRLQILPIEIDGIMVGYCATQESHLLTSVCWHHHMVSKSVCVFEPIAIKCGIIFLYVLKIICA